MSGLTRTASWSTAVVPIMVELIHSIKAKEDAKAAAEEDEDEAREAVEMHLLHGIPKSSSSR